MGHMWDQGSTHGARGSSAQPHCSREPQNPWAEQSSPLSKGCRCPSYKSTLKSPPLSAACRAHRCSVTAAKAGARPGEEQRLRMQACPAAQLHLHLTPRHLMVIKHLLQSENMLGRSKLKLVKLKATQQARSIRQLTSRDPVPWLCAQQPQRDGHSPAWCAWIEQGNDESRSSSAPWGLVKEQPLGQAQRTVPVPCPMPGDVAAPTLLVLSPCQGHLPPRCGTWHSPGTRTIPCQAQHPGPDADGHTWEQGGLQRAANSAVVLSPLSIAAGAPMDAASSSRIVSSPRTQPTRDAATGSSSIPSGLLVWSLTALLSNESKTSASWWWSTIPISLALHQQQMHSLDVPTELADKLLKITIKQQSFLKCKAHTAPVHQTFCCCLVNNFRRRHRSMSGTAAGIFGGIWLLAFCTEEAEGAATAQDTCCHTPVTLSSCSDRSERSTPLNSSRFQCEAEQDPTCRPSPGWAMLLVSPRPGKPPELLQQQSNMSCPSPRPVPALQPPPQPVPSARPASLSQGHI
ncbi:hypothetical protein Anapl_03902 [Anas platyrhynchos]|uniref:Uncharacterized protein n=1 Tax=Anas platyrhynchos TaxID=8839 RepID=R0K4V0_ANAPL|nr:hypothetical protein Anapl_03902 [Anas platyrhynchos]